jgi:hypothetical protein
MRPLTDPAAPAQGVLAAGSPLTGPADGPKCAKPLRECAAAAMELTGGPVRVPFRPCCVAAVLRVHRERAA